MPLPVLRMQWEKPQGTMDENRMIGMAGFHVPKRLGDALNRAAMEASVTANTALLAAFLLCCGRYAWMDPPRVACVIAFNERQARGALVSALCTPPTAIPPPSHYPRSRPC